MKCTKTDERAGKLNRKQSKNITSLTIMHRVPSVCLYVTHNMSNNDKHHTCLKESLYNYEYKRFTLLTYEIKEK